MAITNFFKTDKVISTAELIDYVDNNIDINDDDSLVTASEMLQALANNKNALIDILNRDLLKFDSATGASYSQSSTILGTSKKKPYIIRSNMWPSLANSSVPNIEEALFSYELPHDHNFSFLTANYFGPGYVTDIWECTDLSQVKGYANESVPLRFLERTRLEPGKQMLFRRQHDVHIQHPPEEYSVSLNIMVLADDDRLIDQFEFDVKNNRIAGFPTGSVSSKRAFLMDLAGSLGDENTTDILLKVASVHPCQRTRAAALSSALKLTPGAAAHLAPLIKNDKSAFVQDVLREWR